jgi:hypothetical protein
VVVVAVCGELAGEANTGRGHRQKKAAARGALPVRVQARKSQKKAPRGAVAVSVQAQKKQKKADVKGGQNK